ncbi:hypothetical protein WYO_0202 [Methylobacterium sp. GXF4]|nr:hypothetical protein WYO_0202 [Methylobacterium sp. GXF4]
MSATSMQIEADLRNKLVETAIETRGMSHRLMVSLASEIAMDILPVEQILRSHSITQTEFDKLIRQDIFQQLYREALLAWGATSSASTRIKAKMETGLELALPQLFAEIYKDGLTTAKVELIKTFMKGGGIGERAGGGSGEGGVQIVINMDAQKPAVTIDATPISRDAEDI